MVTIILVCSRNTCLTGVGDDNVGNTEKKKLKESINLDEEVKLLIEGGSFMDTLTIRLMTKILHFQILNN